MLCRRQLPPLAFEIIGEAARQIPESVKEETSFLEEQEEGQEEKEVEEKEEQEEIQKEEKEKEEKEEEKSEVSRDRKE